MNICKEYMSYREYMNLQIITYQLNIFEKHYVLNPKGWVEASKFQKVMGLSPNKATPWLKKNFKVLSVDGKYRIKNKTIDKKTIQVYHGFTERNQTEPEL